MAVFAASERLVGQTRYLAAHAGTKLLTCVDFSAVAAQIDANRKTLSKHCLFIEAKAI